MKKLQREIDLQQLFKHCIGELRKLSIPDARILAGLRITARQRDSWMWENRQPPEHIFIALAYWFRLLERAGYHIDDTVKKDLRTLSARMYRPIYSITRTLFTKSYKLLTTGEVDATYCQKTREYNRAYARYKRNGDEIALKQWKSKYGRNKKQGGDK